MAYPLSQPFATGLKQLDMLERDYPVSSGLVFCDDKPANPYERLALEKARKYKATAVYFRRFEERPASVPQIYIYDFTAKEYDENEIGQLHCRLWNSGQVPLFFIFTRDEIKIFNCLKSPYFNAKDDKFTVSPLETISLAVEINNEIERKLQEFSAHCFDNGSFWDTSIYKDRFDSSESSYQTLLKNLKKIRNDIINNNILPKPAADKLLVISILLKYLEERTDEDDHTVFPPDFFNSFALGARDFIDVLKHKGACLNLFEALGKHFNGEIFKWDDVKERELISQTDLSGFARFLQGYTTETGQMSFWRLYSFNDLPIELISNIYEEFLGDREGVVYRPPYLVRFLIDEVMPLEFPRENFKIIDPSCGSGVFLVAAYQRVIDWWRSRHDWVMPDLLTLKHLLAENIYGIDISPGAVKLTIFSLSLVLLDALSPKEIWEKLKFDNLKQMGNLYDKDFFQLIHDGSLTEKFDLVIGNPPFIAKMTTPFAEKIEFTQIENKKRTKLPDNQLALLFLEQAITVCKKSGLLCLLLPAGPFLYNYSSEKFRQYFLKTYHVLQVLDFTFLRETLFESANAAAAAVFARNEKPVPNESKEILHVTFRRTKAAKENIYLELDRYEQHRIPYRDALNNSLTWKANLLGGGRLNHLIARLNSLPKFGAYLKQKIKYNDWKMAEGFIIGNEEKIKQLEELEKRSAEKDLSITEIEELKKLRNSFKKANHLTGKKYLPTEALTENGIDEHKIHILDEQYFYRSAEENKLIFKGSHILIKEGAVGESIAIAFYDDDLVFKHKIIGIHAPEKDREELLDIETRIKGSRFYLFCAGAFSRQHLISRGTAIIKKDIENLPFTAHKSETELSEIEQILIDDVLDYMPDFRNKGEKAKILQPVNDRQLSLFGETFCKVLNTIYDKYIPQKPVHIHHFVFYPISYGPALKQDITDADHLERHLDQLVYKKIGKSLRVTRLMRIYDQNVIYLVKPALMKYWLRSAAVRDADDTFADLVKQGF